MLLRLFDALGVDPTICTGTPTVPTAASGPTREQALLEGYRRLSLAGRQTVHTMVRPWRTCSRSRSAFSPGRPPRTIPLYASPAAAGYAAPGVQRGL